uniref:Uncharacterized protein n=1 Tax=Biomphalaria glabrata TaxID=6526 RepID=A0A2C9KUQ5_BIOGL
MSDDTYTNFAKKQYRHLFYELAVRSNRAAEMMYTSAAAAEKTYLNCRDNWSYGLFILGIITTAATTAWNNANLVTNSSLIIFVLGLLSSIAGFVFKTVESRIEPLRNYFEKSSQIYIHAASNWQKLEQQAVIYLLKIENPSISLTDIESKYSELIEFRAEITRSVIVPKQTYEEATYTETLERIKKKQTLVTDAIKENIYKIEEVGRPALVAFDVRTRRDAAPANSRRTDTLSCENCDRVCRSKSGLNSHTKSCLRRRRNQHQ